METEIVQDCLFCDVVTHRPEDLRWHDRPIVRVPGVGAVIAGLGAFVPGYVLVFPEQHIESVLKIPAETTVAFTEFLDRIVAAVRANFGSPTVFEHGSCRRTDIRRSACLDHAHIHILPGSYELSRHVPNAHTEVQHPRLAAETLDRSGYLFLHEPAASPIYARDPGKSQFFRRHIAEQLGVPDEWDYLLFPRLENVYLTISRLDGWLT